jgi:glucose/arabinose dehydrogenase
MKRTLFAIAAYLSSCVASFAAPSLKDPTLQVTEVVSGLNSPTTMAFIGPEDMLVLQKNDGKVRRVIRGNLQPGSVLDVNVANNSERGLLGIAVHPSFPTAPFAYLYFTQSSGVTDTSGSAAANRVYRYTWNGTALTSPTLILDLPATPGPNHDGGIITFGPDGKLYVVIGDLNRNGQLQNNPAGDPPDDTGVILRLNADGSVPADNPFSAPGGSAAKYYAYGIRNSFGMAFDPVTQKLWMTENGPGSFDEINQVEPGLNSGWNKLMGPDARDPQNAADIFSLPGSHYSDPKFSWFRPVGVTGIVFLGSTELGAQYQFDAFVGDINNGVLYRFKPNGARDGFVFSGAGLADRVGDDSTELDEVVFGSGFGGITDLKVGPDGLLYVVSFGDGKIYAISPAQSSGPPLALGADSLPVGEVGVAYHADVAITGGTPPYLLAVTHGALPAGLSLAAESIVGIPGAAKNKLITLRATDQLGRTAARRFRIVTVRALKISTRALSPGRGARPYSAKLVAAGGRKPYSWSVGAGALPGGLSLDPASGRITGVPVAPGDTTLIFEVTDPLGGVAHKTLTLRIR